MVIGCVRELVDVSVGGAVVDEIAPAGIATTDSSVVGNWPVAVPFAFTAGAPGAVGALATTELSVVGNGSEALSVREGDTFGEAATSACVGFPARFAFSSNVC